MKTYGLMCNIMDISVDVDTDLGFFEELGGFLWPKAYKVSFTIEVLNKIGSASSGERNIIGYGDDDGINYSRDNNYHKEDVRTWPFGVVNELLEIQEEVAGPATPVDGKEEAKSPGEYGGGVRIAGVSDFLGDDYSRQYADNTKSMIKISKLKHEVAFRPYLKSFSVKFSSIDVTTTLGVII